MANQHQLPWHPSPGQALLYVEFSEIENRTVTEILSVLVSLGYEPKLRYRDTTEGATFYALLREEQRDSGHVFSDDYWFDELMLLYEVFQPYDQAIHCQRGLPSPVAAMAV
jgi:hypothetical protein